MSKMITKEL